MTYTLMNDHYPYYQFKKATAKKCEGNIFFIHGYAVNSDYHNYFGDLVTNYNYYAVEHAGHGITPLKDNKQLNPYSYALEVVKLIKELGLKDIILIGHSMGGGIAVMVSQMIPELIKKMIIVTPMNSKGTISLRGGINFMFNFQPKNEKQIDKFYNIIMYDYYSDKSRVTDTEKQSVMKNQNAYKKNFNKLKHRMASVANMNKLKKAEKDIPVPTLLIVGEGDGCINAKATIKNFTKKNKDIKVHKFEKSGHIPFLEQTQEYYDLIMKFIEE